MSALSSATRTRAGRRVGCQSAPQEPDRGGCVRRRQPAQRFLHVRLAAPLPTWAPRRDRAASRGDWSGGRRVRRGRWAVPSGMRTVNSVPLAERARRADGAAVQGDEFAHQREADARALVRAPGRALDAMEALEDALEILRRQCRRRCRARAARHGRRRPRSATRIEPWNVNLNAFDSRLRTIFSHISRST